MKKVYVLLLAVMIVATGTIAQPTVFYTNLSSTTSPALVNSRLNLSDLGAFRQTRFQTTAAPAPATQTYAFHIGTDAAPDYNANWRPYTPADATGIAYTLNTVTVPATVLNSARYNSFGGGTDGNLAALANTTYYTVNIQENAGIDNLSAIWSHTFNPVTYSGVVQAPLAGSVNPGNPVTVSITSSAALGSGENVFVRYSTNGFVTSNIAQATFVATAGTAVIPGHASGANVSYYIFSSTRTVAQLATIVGTAGIGQPGYDMATLNLENNAGANYSYTVNAGPNPITVNSSGGTPTADYGSLLTAFDAINIGTHTGTITVLVNASTTEVATSVLNASGSGAASYTSIAVNPAGGGARTISGTIVAGSPLIDFIGADNVTVNGLNTGGNSLTISNTTVSATSNTSTLRFTTDATSNTITNCTILGSSTSALGTLSGNIIFGSAAVTTGNDNNTISNCDLGPAGANLPTKLITFTGSSNIDPGTANSGITINNNNFFDWFSPTAAHGAIDVNSGTVNLSITNNRFYQTATRTITTTTSVVHSGVRISNSSGFGYSITGNTFGYASNIQTGTYTIVFPASTSDAVIPITLSVSTVATPLPASVQNNTIAGFALSGGSSGTSSSAPFRGIYVSGGITSIGNVTGNTIGSQSATGSITYTSSSTATSDIMGMFNFGSSDWTVQNNNIGGITAANSSTGAANVYGIRLNTSSTATTTISGNTVGGTVANSLQSSSTATGTQVAGIFVSTSIATVSNNTIRNLTAAGGTGTTTAASVIGINFSSSTPVNNAAQNTIFNLSNTNATAATTVTGIQFTGGTGNVVQRNLIYDLSSATNSATAEVNGIRVGGGTTTYRNNMIRLGTGIANAIGAAATNSGTTGVNGINEFLGTNSFFHNSIYIEGAPTAGTGASYAFNGVQTTNARSFRDNIFFNARSNSGATGKNYAVKINGTAANPTGLTINNNLYFANGTGAVFGFFNSLDVANIAAWKTAVGQDAGSFESNPQYNAPGAATPDLHLHPTNPTVAEGNGVDVGVTDDYDGQTRASLTPVDIGADAGNFVGIDLAAPGITYTALGNTTLTTNRTIAVTITDVTGVATGALAPRIYYNKNAGAYFSTVLSLTSGTVQNGVWTATIDNTLIGGVVATDVIRYYVVAQDVPGNLGANPSGGFTGTDVNTITTPPTIPNSYTIVTAYTGPIPVGTAEIFTSLTNTGGIFDAINNGALTGNVTINLTSDLSGELGTVALNQWAEDGAGNYTILIKPSGAPRTITGSNTGALIRFNGADRVTIDGSTSGATAAACLIGGNAAIRELTIQNTNVGTSAVVISFGSGINGAQNNTIKNVNVLGQDPLTTLLGISLGGTTPGTVGTDNDNNRVENCSLKRSIFGIYSAGASLANQNTGTVITKNDLSATVADRVSRIGVAVFNENGVQITENSVGGMSITTSNDAIGIGVGTQGIDNTNTTAGGVTNALVSNNKINGIASLSATGFSAAGITVAGAPGGANTIRNNMITGVTAPATSPDLVAGIYVVGATGSDTRLYYNSVSMTGDRGVVASQTPSYGIAITGTDPTVELKNNIFYTTQIASGGGVDAKNYAIGMVSTVFTNLNSDYNIFWSTGVQDGGFRTGSLGVAAGTSYATLALWSAAVLGDDANSQEVLPPFVSDLNNLHLSPSVSCATIGKGVNLPSVTTDFDCNSRNTLPFIGAHEAYEPATAATTIAGTVAAGATVNTIRTYLVNGATDYLLNCNIINTLTPAAPTPVSGLVTAGVRVDTGATKMGTPRLFTARFYDVLPAINAAAATGTVKLYYLQSEFDNFNLKALDSNYYPLPDAGNSFALDSLRILVNHGTPSGGYFPGNYSGTIEELSIADAGVSVLWNPAGNGGTGWWEISFPANGFSGYFISSKPRPPLPIKVEYFRGAKQNSSHVLDWKVVPVNTTSGTITLERSSDSRNFSSIYSITATALRMQQAFTYTSTNPLNGINYYRLKLVDDNGVVTYSNIVALINANKGLEFINIAPNPVTEGRFKLNIASAENAKMEIIITDVTGRIMVKQSSSLIAGFNAIDMNVSNLANGVYQVFGNTADGRTRVLQFVKQ